MAVTALTRLPDAELLIVGGPPPGLLGADPEVLRLRDVACLAGVADRVRFTGAVRHDEVAPLLRGTDVVVCPGEDEPYGAVALEAMACARPVVATAVGAHLETVADPDCGRLVPPRDPDALARAVAGLLAEPSLRAGCGAAGRRRALSLYDWTRVATATEAVYGEVCGTPRPRVSRATVTRAA